MTANLVRWALVAALCPLFLSAAPPPEAEPPWDRMAWETFATMVAPANQPGTKAVAFETWADEGDIYTPPSPRWPGPDAKMLHHSLAAAALNAGAAHPMPMVATPGSCQPPADWMVGNFPKNACIG